MIQINGILLENLSVGYEKQVLIDGIGLNVKAGQIVTLIGPNGSGKSTILKTITGQLHKMGGCIYLNGMDVAKMNGTQIAKSLSMVMTNRPHPELMTCREVVSTGRYPYTGKFGILQKSDWEKVDEAIEIVGANEVSAVDFTKISDGQRQRVMLARALCQDTEILILDEPTSFLDMRYKLDILHSIRMMAKRRNMAVLMSLHELDLACKVSDLVACVDGEKVVKTGTPDEIFTEDFIQHLYHVSTEMYDPMTGMMLLPKAEGKAEVFVIGGGGSALPVYNRLNREQIPFAAGILFTNDVEYAAAKGYAETVVEAKAFYPISEDDFMRARLQIDSCKKVICTLQEFGPLNEKNRELMEYAKACGKLDA